MSVAERSFHAFGLEVASYAFYVPFELILALKIVDREDVNISAEEFQNESVSLLLLLSDRKISLELLDNSIRLAGGHIADHDKQLSLVETLSVLIGAICRSRDVMH